MKIFVILSLAALASTSLSSGQGLYEPATVYGSRFWYGKSLMHTRPPPHVERSLKDANLSHQGDASYFINFNKNRGRVLHTPSLYVPEEDVRRDEFVDLSHHGHGETNLFKHVYAFHGPEEPAVRARVVIKGPAQNQQHHQLVFIKAPSSGGVLDQDVYLPAKQEDKTHIYVLQKKLQHPPTIRIHQAQSSLHHRPEVVFAKYRNEAEAQAIASGALAGRHGDFPLGGHLISDGSVTVSSAENMALRSSSLIGNSQWLHGRSGFSFGTHVSPKLMV